MDGPGTGAAAVAGQLGIEMQAGALGKIDEQVRGAHALKVVVVLDAGETFVVGNQVLMHENLAAALERPGNNESAVTVEAGKDDWLLDRRSELIARGAKRRWRWLACGVRGAFAGCFVGNERSARQIGGRRVLHGCRHLGRDRSLNACRCGEAAGLRRRYMRRCGAELAVWTREAAGVRRRMRRVEEVLDGERMGMR